MRLHRLQVHSIGKVGRAAYVSLGPVDLGDPIAAFSADPALTLSDANTNACFRTICFLSEDMGSQFRVGIKPGTSGALTSNHVAMGRWAGDESLPNTTGPLVEAEYDGAAGFAGATELIWSDWMPSGAMAGMRKGTAVVLVYNTGGSGQASQAYVDGSQNTIGFYKPGGTADWNLESVTDFTGLDDLNFANAAIETRGVSNFSEPAADYIPMSFDDPILSGNTHTPHPIIVASGRDLLRRSIEEYVGATDATVKFLGNNIGEFLGIKSREAVRIGASGDYTFRYCFLEAEGNEAAGDHADTIQIFANGARGGTVNVLNSYIKAHLTAATAGFFCADNWGGTINCNHVIFDGGPFGLKVSADDTCVINLSLENVYFIAPFGGQGGPYVFQENGTGLINITKWENVRYATIVDGVLIPGDLIPPPVNYNPVTALGSKLVAYWDANRGDTLSVVDNAVQTWTDIIGGYALSAPDVPGRPVYQSTGLNSAPCLSFNGSQYMTSTDAGLLAALPDGAETSEIWTIVSQDALVADTTERYCVAYAGSSSTTGRSISRVVTSSVNRIRSRTGTGAATNNINDAATDFSGVHVIRQIVEPTVTNLELDGAATSQANIAAVPATTASRLRVGSIGAAGASNNWNGKIVAVLIMNAKLSTDEATALHRYLG